MNAPRNSMDYDVAVIGGGSAGFAAARATAAAGLRVAVLEGAQQLGGLCILRGCMPTKALLHAADVLHQAQKSSLWGIRAGEITHDFAAVMARKAAVIEDFAAYRRRQLENGAFKLVRAGARFLDPHRLELGDGSTLTAEHFVIATGSVIAPPPLAVLEQAGYITSDDALSLSNRPRSLIVLGGGAVAVEFAQFFQRLGTQVTLIQRSPHLLRGFDPDLAEVLEQVFRREGMDLFTGTRLLDARAGDGGKTVEFEHAGAERKVTADEILLALGRTPNSAGLSLENAGVRVDGARIVADAAMRTSAPHIFAAGDCTGPHEIVHVAIQQAEVAAHNIVHPNAPRAMDYRLLTSVVFTDPQLAQVGLTETGARARGIAVSTASYPFNDHGKSIIMDALDGFVKLLAAPGSGEILGGACAGPLAGELIHEIITAMHGRMTAAQLAALPHYHPTLAEIWTYPAEELAAAVAE